MKKRSRSPGLGALALVGTLMIGLPIVASEIGGTNVPYRDATDHSDATTVQGVTANATVMSQRTAVESCNRGKKVIGVSSTYVVRAAIKNFASDCYTCCAETVFIDDFESGDTSAWSSPKGP
jgi:hypothetical protein